MSAIQIQIKIVSYAIWNFALSLFTSTALSSLSRILLSISGIFYLPTTIRNIRHFPLSWLGLLGFTLSCYISILMNLGEINTLYSIAKTDYFITALISVVPLMKAWPAMNPVQIKRIIWLFLISTSIASIAGAIALQTGYSFLKFTESCHPMRSCGLYSHYMTYGYGLSLWLILLFGSITFHSKHKDVLPSKTWLITTLSINLCGLFLSFSRGAWLGFFFALPFLFMRQHIRQFVRISVAISILFASLLVISPQAQSMFFNRPNSNSERLSFFNTAINAFYEKPIFGWGHRNFEPHVVALKKKYDLPFPEQPGHAHSNYLEILASKGFIGLCFFLLFVFAWLKESYNNSPIIFSFIISFLISGSVQYTFGDSENLMLIMIVYCIHTAYITNKKVHFIT